MAVYFITGTLGCGKTLCAVGKIRDYLAQGRRVATNLDINLDAMCKPESQLSITRVPDKPKIDDLFALGVGCIESDEKKYGLLVLDELGTWFNSRKWNDKTRLEVIDWFLHARKLHWDIYFIVQSMDSLDSQLVQALCEHLVICKRTDRLSIPFIGSFLKALGITQIFPKIHIAKVYYGKTDSSMLVDRWWYMAKELYPAYNTDQIFNDESHAIHSVLPAYYTNNIKLLDYHQAQIKKYTKLDKRPKHITGGYKTISSLALVLVITLLSWRTYAKYNEWSAPKPAQIIQVQRDVSLDAKPSTTINPVPVVVPVSLHVMREVDYVEKLVTGAKITVTSHYIADGRINAVLHVIRGEDDEVVITLDDLRAYGYASTIRGNVVTCAKVGFVFNFNVS